MIDRRDAFVPTPAIVIAVGDFAAATATQIRSIYLRSDPRRTYVTRFMSLSGDAAGGIGLVSLDEASPEKNPPADGEAQPSAEVRRAVFDVVLENAGALRAEIGRALYDIRGHEHLMDAGWVAKYDVPMNIFLLADIKEPFAAGAILPVSCLLSDIAGHVNLFRVHILLNTAVFPQPASDASSDQAMLAYTFLLELDDLLQDQSQHRAKLCKAMGCQRSSPFAMPVYLFDCNKEGSYVVTDEGQMQVMVGNALLALMENDMARRVDSMRDAFEVATGNSYYSSIGAVALMYDPESLQLACAKKAAHEFLHTVILSANANLQLAASEAAGVKGELGTLRSWLERCLFEMPPTIGQVSIAPDTNELGILLTDFKLSEIDYGHFHDTPWVRETEEYLVHFDQDTLPQTCGIVSNNAQTVDDDLAGILAARIETLPLKPGLYPGGIENASRALGFLSEHLAAEAAGTSDLQTALDQKESSAARDLEGKLRAIEAIFGQAPKLPRIIRVLPKSLQLWAAPIFYMHRYGPQLLRLQGLKEETIRLVQERCAVQLQREALDGIGALVPRLLQSLEAGKTAYQELQKKVKDALQELPANWPTMPLGQEENGWDRVFRVPLVERCLAEWGFAKWHPAFDMWIPRFLSAESPMGDWRGISVSEIVHWLVALGSEAYSPLWQVTIDDVAALWADKTPEFSSGSSAFAEVVPRSISSAFPLLRPDFDAVGGGGASRVTAHAVLCRPDWQHLHVMPKAQDTSNLEPTYSGDPFAALFLRIRHSVPLRSLTEMTRSAKSHYDSLSEAEQRQYCIIHSKGEVIPVIPLQGGDPSDPDLIHRVFQWKFKPRGSGAEVEQCITIDISRSRFEHYRRKPRFNGEWNRYAEEDVPEIRALAAEFQRLHSDQKWSTYNQAFHVLKFVQTCVPYAYDKDTTGYEDWARYPIETLVEGKGDCEDLAVLCAAIIARLGFQTVLLLYPSHVAFGVAGAENLRGDYVEDPRNSNRYFYGEATSDGWHLGQIPKHYQDVRPESILDVRLVVKDE